METMHSRRGERIAGWALVLLGVFHCAATGVVFAHGFDTLAPPDLTAMKWLFVTLGLAVVGAGFVVVHGADAQGAAGEVARRLSIGAVAFVGLVCGSGALMMSDSHGPYLGLLVTAGAVLALWRTRHKNVPLPRLELDRFLPDYDVHEIHQLRVDASPAQVLAAVRELRFSDLRWPVAVLVFVRALPALLCGRRNSGPHADAPMLKQLEAEGFPLLADAPNEIVFGIAGKFWKMSPEIAAIAGPDEFVAFARAGQAKVAVNIAVLVEGRRTLLSTETRVLGVDAQAKRAFRRYWRVISLGSAWIRVLWLQAIKKRAERMACSATSPEPFVSAEP